MNIFDSQSFGELDSFIYIVILINLLYLLKTTLLNNWLGNFEKLNDFVIKYFAFVKVGPSIFEISSNRVFPKSLNFMWAQLPLLKNNHIDKFINISRQKATRYGGGQFMIIFNADEAFNVQHLEYLC